MNCWTVKVHTTLGCTGMWGRETIGWSVVEVWYLGLDYVDIDCGSWLSWEAIVLMESYPMLGNGMLLRVYQQ
jgi:hypothetical protein